MTQTCHDGSLLVIGTQNGAEEKKMEEPKDSATTPVPSPHTTIVPSSHATLVSSPHHSPVPLVSASLLKPSGSPIHIVDLGDGKSSSSKSTESDDVEKKTREVDKSHSSSKLISQDLKNSFS